MEDDIPQTYCRQKEKLRIQSKKKNLKHTQQIKGNHNIETHSGT